MVTCYTKRTRHIRWYSNQKKWKLCKNQKAIEIEAREVHKNQTDIIAHTKKKGENDINKGAQQARKSQEDFQKRIGILEGVHLKRIKKKVFHLKALNPL